jgi:ABC-type phosphate/phosphonate transport system substrate-binding protein
MSTRILATKLLPAFLLCLTATTACLSRAAETLQVRIYSSLLAGVSDKHALAFTRPVVDLISRDLDYPLYFDIAKGETAEDLFRFGQQIEDGEVHVGIVWGLEYGWLQERFPRFKPMAVTRHRTDSLRSQLMVHPDNEVTDIAGLKGKQLATYRRIPLMDRMYLTELIAGSGHTLKTYFGKITEYPTAKDAIIAVHNDKADCVMINTMVYHRHIANRPKLKMKEVALSDPFPQAVLMGRPDRVDALRAGLWPALQECLERVDDTPEGRQGLDFWRQENFILPDEKEFGRLVRDRVSEYPITALERVVLGGRP